MNKMGSFLTLPISDNKKITTDIVEISRILNNNYFQISSHLFNNMSEMNTFFWGGEGNITYQK